MKKVLVLLITSLFFFACSPAGSEQEEDEQKPKNPMIGTSWEANDGISTLIWGSSISRLEFLDAYNFQDVSITKGSVRKIDKGTYTYNTGNVFLLYPKYHSDGKDMNILGKISGSFMTTNRGTLPSGTMTYQKK